MSAAAPTDEALVAGFAAGDEGAFETLYERHEQPLWRFLVRLCRDRGTAEEVMQATWFAVMREAPNFRADGRFAPWLYTIARNRVIDVQRTLRPMQSLDEARGNDAEGEAPVALIADEHALSPPDALQQLQQGEAILAAIGQLPPEQAEAFVLQMEGELSVEDIARVTGTTYETAKSRLRYARDKLKSLLRDHAP